MPGATRPRHIWPRDDADARHIPAPRIECRVGTGLLARNLRATRLRHVWQR